MQRNLKPYEKRISAPSGKSSELFRTAVFIILSGGFQDAYTFIARGKVFANAQTGNIVLLSAALFRGEWATALKYAVPLAAFFFGVLTAEGVHYSCRKNEKMNWRQLILIAEVVLLLCVGFIPDTANAAANAIVSFVCALQVQSFHKINGHIYASTMCIGNMRSGAESLFAFFRTHEKEALKKRSPTSALYAFSPAEPVPALLSRPHSGCVPYGYAACCSQ